MLVLPVLTPQAWLHVQVPSVEDRQELPGKKMQALEAVLERMIEAWDSSEGEAHKSSRRAAGLYNKVLS